MSASRVRLVGRGDASIHPICLTYPTAVVNPSILLCSGRREGLAPGGSSLGLQVHDPSLPIRSALRLNTMLLPMSPSVCLAQALHPKTVLALNHETHDPCLFLLSPFKYL